MTVHQTSNPVGSKDTPSSSEFPKDWSEAQIRGKGKGKVNAKSSKGPWADLFRKADETVDPSFNLSFCPPINGTAVLEEREIWIPPKPWKFGLLGCFAGRFPGMEGIEALVKSWKVKCKANPQPNGFVLFRFQTEEDRCSVLSSGPFFLYGKRLFFDSLPENFRIENEDLCMKPTWVRFTDLPSKCWKPAAFSKIASCIGNPICMDKVTKIGKKRDYARILVEIDSTIPPLDYVPVLLPNGEKFNQAVYYEDYPCFCMHCKSVRHYKEQCPKLEPLPGSGDRREARQIVNCKRVGLEWKWKNIVQSDCNPELGLENTGALVVSGKEGLVSATPLGENNSGNDKEEVQNTVLAPNHQLDGDERSGQQETSIQGKSGPKEGEESVQMQIPRGIVSLVLPEFLSKINSLDSQLSLPKAVPVVTLDHSLLNLPHSKGLEIVPFKPSVVFTRSHLLDKRKDSSWEDVTELSPSFSSFFPSLAFDKDIMALQRKAKQASKDFKEFQQEANRVCKRFAEMNKSPVEGTEWQPSDDLKEKPFDFKAALMSPPKQIHCQVKNGGKLKHTTKTLPVPLRAKSLFKGNGRRRPTQPAK